MRGRVVDERGAPLTAAQIELRQSGGVETICSFDRDHRFALDDPAASIHTDGDGRYVLHDVPVLAGDDAKTEIWADAKSASGGALARTRVEVALVAGAEVAAPDLVMRPAVEVARPAVHFVDEAGRDVPGAAFFTFLGSRDVEAAGSFGNWESRADGTGRGEINGIDSASKPPQIVRVVARNDGFATAVVELPEAPTETTIKLAPEHRLHGVVRGVDGRPGFADVSAVTIGDANAELPGVGGFEPTSPASGRFVVRALSAGPWRVVATRRHHDGTNESATLESVTDENVDLEIVLKGSGDPIQKYWFEPGAPRDPAFGRVEIVVRMAGSGKPVVHADFSFGRPGHERTDAQPIAPGRFRIDHVEPGEMPLEVAVKNAKSATRSIAVNAGTTTEVAFEIDAGRTLAGHVALDELPKGRWISLIAIESTRGEETHFDVATDGAFQLRGLDPDRSYRLALDFVERSCQQHWICAEAPRAATEGDADVCVARGYELPLGRHLLPGSYTVRFELPDGTTEEQSVTVATGDESAAVHFDER